MVRVLSYGKGSTKSVIELSVGKHIQKVKHRDDNSLYCRICFSFFFPHTRLTSNAFKQVGETFRA